LNEETFLEHIQAVSKTQVDIAIALSLFKSDISPFLFLISGIITKCMKVSGRWPHIMNRLKRRVCECAVS